jgi:hypothetical protein
LHDVDEMRRRRRRQLKKTIKKLQISPRPQSAWLR